MAPERHTPAPRFTVEGLNIFLVFPIPSWPLPFDPKHSTSPPLNRMHVWLPPAVTAMAKAPEKTEENSQRGANFETPE